MKEEIQVCSCTCQQSLRWVSLGGLGGVRREENKENSFLGLEAEELIFDR